MIQKCYFNNEILSKLVFEMFHDLKCFKNSYSVHKMGLVGRYVFNVKLHIGSQMLYYNFFIWQYLQNHMNFHSIDN